MSMAVGRRTVKITLGQYLASIRADRKMTLREVEEATNKVVSNAYLSQIENGCQPIRLVMPTFTAAGWM